MRAVAFVLLATACSSKSAENADAFVSLDAACDPGTVFTPISVTGTSPVGSLEIFHYATARFVSGFCPDAYLIELTPRQASFTCYGDPYLLLSIYPPFHASGTHMAQADVDNMHEALTQQVTFEATRLDDPSAASPRIVGHFVSSDPAWSFDIAIDLTSQFSTVCI